MCGIIYRCLVVECKNNKNPNHRASRFLLQCLEDLDRSLKKLNSRLFVIRGQPADTLPRLMKKWSITCLSFEEDPEPFGRVRDQHVQKLCAEMGVQVISCVSHTLFQLEKLVE